MDRVNRAMSVDFWMTGGQDAIKSLTQSREFLQDRMFERFGISPHAK